MLKTLVIQSYKTESVPSWIEQCQATVAGWAKSQAYDYRFVGDEIFDLVPNWYMQKIGDKLPVATDFARLVLLQEALDAGYQQAIWFDADMLICDQSLSIDFSNSCAFGQEIWVQQVGKKYRAVKNVHNAVCVFKQACPVLPFLIQTVKSIIQRVDASKIPPQMVGPKLLTALHNIAGFSLLPEVGALSPDVVKDLITGNGKALTLLELKAQSQLKAANLCASLIDTKSADVVIERILSKKAFY